VTKEFKLACKLTIGLKFSVSGEEASSIFPLNLFEFVVLFYILNY